jgi:hypothetical protein
MVGTACDELSRVVADPTVSQDHSFFSIRPAVFASGWVDFEYRISNKKYRMMKCGIASL